MSVLESLDLTEEPASVDLDIWEGRSLAFDIEYSYDDSEEIPEERRGEPVDITGFEAKGEIRLYPGGPLQAAFDCTIDDPTLGVVSVELSSEDSVGIQNDSVYDVVIESGTSRIGLVRGEIHVTRRVTQ